MENKKQNEFDKLNIQNLINKKKLQILELMKLNKSTKSIKSNNACEYNESYKVNESYDTVGISELDEIQKKIIFCSTTESNPDNVHKFNESDKVNNLHSTITPYNWATSCTSSGPHVMNKSRNIIDDLSELMCTSSGPGILSTKAYYTGSETTSSVNPKSDISSNGINELICSNPKIIQHILGREIKQSSHKSTNTKKEDNNVISDSTHSLELLNDPRDNIHNYPVTIIGDKCYISKPTIPINVNHPTLYDEASSYDINMKIKENEIDDSIPNCSIEIDFNNLHIEI